MKASRRECGPCQACCEIVPVSEIKKPALTRCQHQAEGVGCAIYRGDKFPRSCANWSCVWLTGRDFGHLRRPDFCGFVVDPVPDVMEAIVGGRRRKAPVVQVWTTPDKVHATWQNKRLQDYIEECARRGAGGAAIRCGSGKVIAMAAPWVTGADGWIVTDATMTEREHTAEEIAEAMIGRGVRR